MSYWHAIFLGVIQGLTEFLPVSSSGHMAISQAVMAKLGAQLPPPDSPQMIAFDLATHLGTTAAIFAVFYASFGRWIRELVRSLGQLNRPLHLYRRNPAVRVLLLAIAASIPTAIIGLELKGPLQSLFARPLLISAGWTITAALLLLSDRPTRRRRRGLRQFGVITATVIGVAQGAAIAPGISRSGSTICTALLCGIKRRWAAEFSFLIAVPAILGAAAMEFISETDKLAGVPIGPVVVGALTAAVVGYAALRVLLRAVRRAKLWVFAIYCLMLALAVVIAVGLKLLPARL